MNLAKWMIRLTGDAVKFMVLLLVWCQKLPTAPECNIIYQMYFVKIALENSSSYIK